MKSTLWIRHYRYDMTTASNLHMLNLLRNCVEERLSTKSNIPFRVELFSLHKINGTDGYCKKNLQRKWRI